MMTDETDNHEWSEWHHNPFSAIAEAATKNGKPEDIEKLAGAILEIMSWSEVNEKTLLDDLLQEIAGATGIVVQYVCGGESSTENDGYDFHTSFRAAYDKPVPSDRPKR